MLYICYKGTIFVSEIKQNTNSTDPRRSLKSATKIMKKLTTMATKINASDVNVMTFNADPFVASDEYGEEELQEILNEAYITELNGFDAEQAREMLDYFADDDVRVYKGVSQEGDVFYFSTNCTTSLEGLDTPSYCKVVDTNTGKAIVGFASFAEAEEIAKKYDLTMHSYTKRDGERVWTDCGWDDAPFDMRKVFIEVDRLSLYEKSDAEGLREDAASFDEDEEALAERLNDIADILDKISENEIVVVFNDVPELTYEVWDRYKVGYHDYDVHQYEIGLKK